MELFTYECTITVSASESDNFSSRLWHFANLFSCFSYTVNDNYLSALSSFEEIVKATTEDQPNTFVLTISDHNYNYIHKAIELLDFSLMESDVQLSFVPVD